MWSYVFVLFLRSMGRALETGFCCLADFFCRARTQSDIELPAAPPRTAIEGLHLTGAPRRVENQTAPGAARLQGSRPRVSAVYSARGRRIKSTPLISAA